MQSIRMFRCYKKLLAERPYFVQSIQTVSLMSVGDLISQSLIEKKDFTQVNYYRVIKFGSIGFILGPALTSWYRFLDKVNFNSLRLVLFKKLALDQLVFAPCALAFITTLLSISDGKNMEEIKEKMRTDYLSILFANYKLWPLVQCVNFSIVPLNYRVLVTQSVAVGWNTYLAWKLNNYET